MPDAGNIGMNRMVRGIILVAFLLSPSCRTNGGDEKMADLILTKGRIFTADSALPRASAAAIRDGKLIRVGSDASVRSLTGRNTRVVDLGGKFVLPGFNDAHVHFSEGGFALLGIDLRDAKDETEFARRIGDYARTLKKGEWITRGNWDHENWPSRKHPRKDLLAAITPDHPVLVYRFDGHIALANGLALRLAGIDRKTPNPAGGVIEKDAGTGEPTGILKDAAIRLTERVIPPPSPERLELAVRTALTHARELGVTSIQDNSSREDLSIYQRLANQGELTVRINAMRPVALYENYARIGIRPPFGDPFLRLGTVKLFVDGSMGAGTALFFDPYLDDPSTSGIPIYPEEDLDRLVQAVDRDGLQIAAHAIGDRANAWILNAFEKARRGNGVRDSRHRIEHAQVVRAADVGRFREFGVIASIQPSHCIDDMKWAEKRIGSRVSDAYRFQSLVQAGVRTAFGTDWPVEPLNPMLGLYAAVTREFPDGGPRGGWHPGEKISLEKAIELYTIGSAYAEFQENAKGTIAVGKLADLVVLDRDLFQISRKEILQAKVVMTILGGRIVYQNKKY
jgi:predicted amidohydrolase YtcJ